MSVYAPNSDVRLLSAPLTYGDGNQLDFASLAAQTAYFTGLTGITYNDCTYQRKDRYIRVPALADTLYQYNYCTYTNFNGKRIYAFITKIEFINQNCSHVHIRTDVFQTWMFDFTFKQCLVVREHTPTDNFMDHTLPENIIDTPAREVNRMNALEYSLRNQTVEQFDANYRVLIVCSEAVAALGGGGTVGQVRFGAVPAGCYYYGVERAHVRDALDALTVAGKIDTILTMYCVPIGGLSWVSLITTPFNVWLALDSRYSMTNMPMATEYTSLSYFGNNIRNKKCLLYPYHYYRLHNGAGQGIDLEPQRFGATTIYIKSWFDGNCAPSVVAMPAQYDTTGSGDNWGGATNPEFQINYANFPDVPYTVDVYERYLAENRAMLQYQTQKWILDTGINAAKTAAGAGFMPDLMTENAPSGAESGAMGLYSTAMEMQRFMANLSDLQRKPDVVKGAPSGSADMLAGNAGIWLSEYCIRPEYLRIVDQYFTAYGYKVNVFKTPQFNSRPNHNYLQTDGCDIEGHMPQDDADELCAMFNAGLTVWHNPSTFGNYTPNNAPS